MPEKKSGAVSAKLGSNAVRILQTFWPFRGAGGGGGGVVRVKLAVQSGMLLPLLITAAHCPCWRPLPFQHPRHFAKSGESPQAPSHWQQQLTTGKGYIDTPVCPPSLTGAVLHRKEKMASVRYARTSTTRGRRQLTALKVSHRVG